MLFSFLLRRASSVFNPQWLLGAKRLGRIDGCSPTCGYVAGEEGRSQKQASNREECSHISTAHTKEQAAKREG